MEQANAEEEESQFTQIKPTRKREPKHNITQGGQEVAWLNASRGEMVGPGTAQEIYEGDSVTLSVHGKFLDEKNTRVNGASFATVGGKTALLDQLNELALNTSRAGGANPIAVLNLVDILAKDLQKKETPEAYLIYALYDEDSNRYEVGKKVLTRNAANQHEELKEKLAIKKNGYIETFVVNETAQDVWFDNMMVMSISSPIVQETHYDPWGLELTGLGFQYGGIKANKYLYNGKELIEDNGLQYYDYGARMYDPAIGRWGVHDPLAEKARRQSPYNYALNNPMRFIDPDGMEAYSVMGTPVITGESAANQEEEDVWVEMGYGKVRSSEVMGADYIGNFETVGKGEKSQGCCGENKKNSSTQTPQGQGVDPYQNGHGETIYTMDQFINANKGLTRSEIINQRQDRSKTFLGSQPGGPNMRYVVNPHDGRVLDMRHMLVVGKQPVAVGNLLEVFQWGTGQASGMDRQDFYSNGVGYQFYMQYSGLQNLFYPNTFTDQMRNFFYNPRVIYNW
jgi:RHS repeat-associated protein